MEILVNKIKLSLLLLIINASISAQSKHQKIGFWENQSSNSLIVENRDQFNFYCSTNNALSFEKIDNKFIQLSKKDFLSFEFCYVLNDKVKTENNLRIHYRKKWFNKLKFENNQIKSDLTFKKMKKLVEYDSIVFYQYIADYELNSPFIVDRDTFNAGFYERFLFNKIKFLQYENINIDIFTNQIIKHGSLLSPFPNGIEEGSFFKIKVYLKNGDMKEITEINIPKYIGNYVLPKEKWEKLKPLFKSGIF